jgi:hypothetical protein
MPTAPTDGATGEGRSETGAEEEARRAPWACTSLCLLDVVAEHGNGGPLLSDEPPLILQPRLQIVQLDIRGSKPQGGSLKPSLNRASSEAESVSMLHAGWQGHRIQLECSHPDRRMNWAGVGPRGLAHPPACLGHHQGRDLCRDRRCRRDHRDRRARRRDGRERRAGQRRAGQRRPPRAPSPPPPPSPPPQRASEERPGALRQRIQGPIEAASSRVGVGSTPVRRLPPPRARGAQCSKPMR